MNINLQRSLDRWVGSIACFLLSLFSRFRQARPAPDKVNRVLVILLSEMGSLILAYPMFKRIGSRYPHTALYALVFKKNQEVLELLKVMPEQHILTLDDSSLISFTRDYLRIIRRLRQLNLDIVIDCELFARVSSILSFLSGAAVRVGFHAHTQEGLYRGSFINRPVLYNPYRHISKQFLTLVDAITADTFPLAKHIPEEEAADIPRCTFSQQEITAMQRRLFKDYPTLEGLKLVLLYPGGGLLPIRAWPQTYYCQLANTLLGKGLAVGIIGLAADKHLARLIRQECRHPACVDLTGYTRTIRELMLIFQFTGLLVTNDGGPVHFAALTRLPSIIFFGPETPLLYGPLNNQAAVFYKPIPCSPCLTAYNHRQSPCDGDNVCLQQISPEAVSAKALAMLEHSLEPQSVS